MKQKVLAFFQAMPAEPYEQFNEAFALYRNSPAKNPSAERSYNASGYSPHMLESLLYDLQKAFDITDTERYTKLEVRSEKEEGGQKLEVRSDGEVENKKLEVSDRDIDVPQLTEFQKDFIPIREDFPFLNDKDCPNELKILVADKITVWKDYEAAQEKIRLINENKLASQDGELEKLAKISVDSFEENQRIYDELNAYKNTGLVLGVHPIFKELKIAREVEAMTNDELIKYKNASAKYFSVNKTALAKAQKENDTAKVQEIENRVAERSQKLFLVNKKLGV
jgi:hypothetical protein